MPHILNIWYLIFHILNTIRIIYHVRTILAGGSGNTKLSLKYIYLFVHNPSQISSKLQIGSDKFSVYVF